MIWSAIALTVFALCAVLFAIGLLVQVDWMVNLFGGVLAGTAVTVLVLILIDVWVTALGGDFI